MKPTHILMQEAGKQTDTFYYYCSYMCVSFHTANFLSPLTFWTKADHNGKVPRVTVTKLSFDFSLQEVQFIHLFFSLRFMGVVLLTKKKLFFMLKCCAVMKITDISLNTSLISLLTKAITSFITSLSIFSSFFQFNYRLHIFFRQTQ